MTSQDGRIPADADVNESNRHESDVRTRRLAALLMVLFALLLGVLTWFANDVTATHASSSMSRAAEAPAVQKVEHAPAARASKGIEPEEHIQAF
jgi:hypothetical protein